MKIRRAGRQPDAVGVGGVRRRRWAIAATPPGAIWWVAGAAAAMYGLFIGRSGFRIDGRLVFSLGEDAMVSMRYARNLAGGAGLTWNPGWEPVEGYSNLLWTLWMAAVHLLPVPEAGLPAVVMASGAGLLLANLAVVWALAGRLAPGIRRVQLAAVALVAFHFPLVFWTLRGYEVGLVALLMSVSLLLVLRLRAAPSGRGQAALSAALAAGMLARDDFAVFALIAAAGAIGWAPAGGRARAAAIVLGGPLAAIAGHEALRLAYYGELLPNTYHLKLSGVGLEDRLPRGLASLASAGLAGLYAPVALAGLALVSAPAGLRPGAWLLAAAFAGQCAYSAYVGGDSFEIGMSNRFVSPATPALLVLAAMGIDAAFGSRPAASRRALTALAAALGLGALAAVLSLAGDPGTARLSKWLLAPVRGSVAQAALLGGLGLLCLARLAPARGQKWLRPALERPLFAPAAVVLLLAASGSGLWTWAAENAPYLPLDRRLAAYGIVLRQTTSPQASIAVTAAGATPYFSHRRAIDLLGRADAVIARSPPRSPDFWPGHNKWSYEHSIGRLRPDLIAGVWGLTRAEERLLADYGYEPLPHGRDLRVVGAVYVRSDSTRVDRGALDRWLPWLFPPR